MNSEKVHVHSYRISGQDLKLKCQIKRVSTRSMTCNEEEIQQFQNFVQERSDQSIEAPSPVSSSDVGSSVQLKYLSYLTKVIDSAPQSANQLETQQHYHRAQYWNVIFECAIYVKKEKFRTQIDDSLISSEFDQYLKPNRVHPDAINKMGQQLMKNGYFLSAYAINIGRKRQSYFLFRYLIQQFAHQYQIQTNQEQLCYILENYVRNGKQQQILHLNINTNSQTFVGQNLNDIQQNRTPGNFNNQLLVRKSRFDNTPSPQASQCSRTIVLEDDPYQDNI